MVSRKLVSIASIAAVATLSFGLSSAWGADGAAVYKEQCAKCHGETGKADTPVGQALKVPSLVGDENVAKMSPADVAERIKTNDKHPPTVKELDAADIEAAADYAKSLAAKK